MAHGAGIDFRCFSSNVKWIELSGNLSRLREEQIAAIPPPAPRTTILVINGKRGWRMTEQRRDIARRGVRLSVVENADMPELQEWCATIEAVNGIARIRALLDFAHDVMTGIDADEVMSRLDTLRQHAERKPATDDERALLAHLGGPTFEGVATLLSQLGRNRTVFRPDLHHSLCQACRLTAGGRSLPEAARTVQARRAEEGRRVEPRAIGSTLLLKGLEAEHAVVLDADEMAPSDLYVAISRASRSLTVVSRSPVLPVLPAAA